MSISFIFFCVSGHVLSLESWKSSWKQCIKLSLGVSALHICMWIWVQASPYFLSSSLVKHLRGGRQWPIAWVHAMHVEDQMEFLTLGCIEFSVFVSFSHMLVHSSDGCSGQCWARPKVSVRSFFWFFHRSDRVPCTWTIFSFSRPLVESWIESRAARHAFVPICNTGFSGGGFTNYVTMPNPQ